MRDKKNKIQKQGSRTISELTPARKRVYMIMTLLLPLLFITIVEIGLRMYHYGGTTDLFVSLPDETSSYYGMNVKVAQRYFRKLSDVPIPRKDLFLKEKPKNGYRIFVLGESAAAGFPYGNNVTFPRILDRQLSDMFPEKRIEIINTALAATNTYTQLDFMDDILQNKPDAILIYSGHNEYYGALGVGSAESFGKSRWIVRAALALQKFKIYMLIRDMLNGIGNSIGGNSAANEKSNPSATLMERIVQNKLIPLHSEEYERGVNQFRENIRGIIEKAQRAGVKVIISELVSNVRDNEPFESIEGTDSLSARKVYDAALKYEKQEKYDEAKNDFYAAKDLDALRFRAPEEFNKVIHDAASEFHIPVVPMKAYFESHSPHYIIGDNLMLEHLHPNLGGYFLMADAFLNTMQEEKFISADWQERQRKPTSYYRAVWGFTDLDSVYASLIVTRLKSGWPFKKNGGPNLAFEKFIVSNKVDSIVMNILAEGTMTLEQGHIELANYYEKRGELEKAFKEYNALIYTVPYFDSFYGPAVMLLMEMNNYEKALQVLLESLKYQETFFTYQWIGQIYLMTHNTLKGINFLEKAREKDPQNSILLYNLGCAYFNTSQFEKGNEILGRLKNSSHDIALISKLETLKKDRSTGMSNQSR